MSVGKFSDGQKGIMKTFSIFEHPDHRLEAVKQGYSFPGLFGGGFWLLWHKMWLPGAVALVVGIAVYLLFPSPQGYVYGIPYGHRFGLADIMNIGICVGVGLWGNAWRAASLRDRGFEHVGTEQGATPDGAKAAYLRRASASGREPAFERREPV